MSDQAKHNRVLIACANPDDFFLSTLAYHLEQEGWQVQLEKKLEACKNFLNEHPDAHIVIDSPFKTHDILMEHICFSRDLCSLSVVQLLSNPHTWRKRLRVLGHTLLEQPFEVQDVSRALNKAKSDSRPRGADCYVRLSVPPEDVWLDSANDFAGRLMTSSKLSDAEQVKMCSGFREALGNAAQHAESSNALMTIDAEFFLLSDRIEISVTDAGNGFDWSSLLSGDQDALEKRRKRAAEGRQGGLGILMMEKCADELRYNDKGNVVTLIKYFAKERSSSSSQQRALAEHS